MQSLVFKKGRMLPRVLSSRGLPLPSLFLWRSLGLNTRPAIPTTRVLQLLVKLLEPNGNLCQRRRRLLLWKRQLSSRLNMRRRRLGRRKKLLMLHLTSQSQRLKKREKMRMKVMTELDMNSWIRTLLITLYMLFC